MNNQYEHCMTCTCDKELVARELPAKTPAELEIDAMRNMTNFVAQGGQTVGSAHKMTMDNIPETTPIQDAEVVEPIVEPNV